MNDLQELLAGRDERPAVELLAALRDGLAADAAASGPAADLHRLLQGYFRLDETASASSFGRAFRKQRPVADALRQMLHDDGQAAAAALMQSLIDDRPAPTGALRQGLDEARAAAQGQPAGIQAALQGFAAVALDSDRSSAEMEMSLAWPAVEEALLDRVAAAAEVLAFAHGPAHRAAVARTRELDALAAGQDAGALLAALAGLRGPRLLATASEWDVAKAGADAQAVEIPVCHRLQPPSPGPAEALRDHPAGRQVAALYAVANGAELFIPTAHEPGDAGLVLIPDSAWDAEREHMMTWLTMGGEDGLPDWARTMVPLAALSGDASRWAVPLEGPHAGAVLLSNDDVWSDTVRYASVTHFLADLRHHPHRVLENGGYVSYLVPGRSELLYPSGFVADDEPRAG